MNYITWDYYDIWYEKRRYQVLIPKNASQFWVTYYLDSEQGGMDFDFYGNRKGLEALLNACALLSEKNDFVIYFPCKKNSNSFLYNYFINYGPYCHLIYTFVDFVFMKPGSLKISDWKQIRSRISKMKKNKNNSHFKYSVKDIPKKDKKYEYREEIPQLFYNYDTVFLNSFSFKYPEMASEVKKFLEPDLEKIFLEDIRRNDHRLRGENYLWYYCHRARGFESGIFFWDDDIYQKARRMGYSGPTDGKPIISYFAQL